jgi:hypothetical protein
LIAQGAAVIDRDFPCKVLTGLWFLPYSSEYEINATEIDIDHVVPLNYAWYNGAQAWPKARRVEFANDSLNLVVSSQAENRSKGDSPPHEWMPADTSYWCTYSTKWQAVVQKYNIATTVETQIFLKVIDESCNRYKKSIKIVDKACIVLYNSTCKLITQATSYT